LTTALIDGDVVAFRSAYSVERDFPEAFTQESIESRSEAFLEAVEAATTLAQDTIEAWRNGARCDDVIVAFSGGQNYRKRVLPTYKANRDPNAKPKCLGEVVDRLLGRYRAHRVAGLEADDLLGLMLTGEKHRGNAVVVSIDKDMKTLPGLHLNPMHDSAPMSVSAIEADYRWMLQTMAGDPVDGYSGIPKIGPAKGQKVLGRIGEKTLSGMWRSVLDTAKAKGLTEKDMLAQARVARILRHGDYDKEGRRVRLWTPSGRPEEWLSLEG
jgi:DNA polymerase-1